MIEERDDEPEDLEGDIITDEDLASAVADDMGSDDPVVRKLWDDLIRGEHARSVMAEAETRRVIEFNKNFEHRFQEGVGQLVARIPMSVYLHWTAVHGHEFWDQPDSLEFLAKRAGGGRGNPGLLIETKGKATMIVDRKLGAPAPQTSPREAGTCGKKPRGGQALTPRGSSAIKGKRGRWAAA